MASFTHTVQAVNPQSERIKHIKISVCVADCTGTIYIIKIIFSRNAEIYQ